jgi:hypothetical protein
MQKEIKNKRDKTLVCKELPVFFKNSCNHSRNDKALLGLEGERVRLPEYR